jgi:DNA-binding CsgD family transcriptional regulator
MVVVGEAGVGKTRLLTEAVRQARSAGVTVLVGFCLPLTDSVPFLPVTEALRALGSAGGIPVAPAVLERCEPHVRSELARLIPVWGLTRDLGEQALVEGWRRGRLFSALRDLLAALSAENVCALVVEDVHWADATTLDFLAYLSAVDRDGAVPLVMTCREEEMDPKRPVGRWFAELARREGVSQLSLGRLSRTEVAAQLRGLLNAAVPASLVDEVFARAGGNAFFTEQVVAHAAGEGVPTLRVVLPRSLARMLLAHVEAVGQDGREALMALAVAGRGLDEGLLTSITGLAGARLRVAVRELAAARLIDRPGVDGRYRLRHALVGEAVIADMLVGDRRERHAGIARALTVNAAAEGAGELAEHWAAAGEVTEEMPSRFAAATEAEHVYAHREAARHWRRLIDLWPRVPQDARPAKLDLATAYLNALAALDRCGDTETAGPLVEKALRTLASTADRRKLALLYERAAIYRSLDDELAALEPLETAIDLLAELPPGREHARVFCTYARSLHYLGRTRDARRYLDRALAACRSGAPTRDEVRVLRELARTDFDEGDIDAGLRLLDQARSLAERNDDLYAAAGVVVSRAWAMMHLGRLDDAAAVARGGLEAARRAGLEQNAGTKGLLLILFDAVAELGRPADAESIIRAATETIPTPGNCFDHMARADLDMLAGDLVAATTRWAAIAAASPAWDLNLGRVLLGRTVLDLWTHRPTEALSRLQHVAGRLDAQTYRDWAAPILTSAMRTCADLAETARARQDAVGKDAANRFAQNLVDAHATMQPDPFARHPYLVSAAAEGATWAAEVTRAAGTPDPDAWAAAASAWTSLHRPHRTAYARWRQAEALLTAGRSAEAGECLREAAAAAHSHAPLLAEIRSLARLARVELHDQPPSTDPTPAPYGLTPRETTVLQLVSAGLTNTQIGSQLFISEKTASVHVTNILRKLGVKNRTQAAALAERAGLRSPNPT